MHVTCGHEEKTDAQNKPSNVVGPLSQCHAVRDLSVCIRFERRMGRRCLNMPQNICEEEERYFDRAKFRRVWQRIYCRGKQDQRENGDLHYQEPERRGWRVEFYRGLLDRHCAFHHAISAQNRQRRQGDAIVPRNAGFDLFIRSLRTLSLSEDRSKRVN